MPYSFSRDFSKFTYVENGTQLHLGLVAGLRSLGKLDQKQDKIQVKAAAYSPDNNYVLSAHTSLHRCRSSRARQRSSI